MKSIFSGRFAGQLILAILALVVVFHLLVLSGVISYTIVWGGRINSREQMIVFELLSIALNMLMIGVVALKMGLLKINIHHNVIQVALWMMFGLFLLNTFGNLNSLNTLEKMVFTPITFLLALLCLRLVKSQTEKNSKNI